MIIRKQLIVCTFPERRDKIFGNLMKEKWKKVQKKE